MQQIVDSLSLNHEANGLQPAPTVIDLVPSPPSSVGLSDIGCVSESMTQPTTIDGNVVPFGIGPIPTGDGVLVSFHETTNVLLMDFAGTKAVTANHLDGIAHQLENLSVSLVFNGLLPRFPDLESYLGSTLGLNNVHNCQYSKFRRYDKVLNLDEYGMGPFVTYKEQPDICSLSPKAYFEYLHKHFGCVNDTQFSYKRGDVLEEIDATQVVFYMIDIEMKTLCPELYRWFQNHFKIKEMLPYGSFCAMNSVSSFPKLSFIRQGILCFCFIAQLAQLLWYSFLSDWRRPVTIYGSKFICYTR